MKRIAPYNELCEDDRKYDTLIVGDFGDVGGKSRGRMEKKNILWFWLEDLLNNNHLGTSNYFLLINSFL